VLFKTGSEGFSISNDNKLYLIYAFQIGENGIDVTYIYDPAKSYTAN